MKCKASLINRKGKYKDEEIKIAQTQGKGKKFPNAKTHSLFIGQMNSIGPRMAANRTLHVNA